MYKTLAELNLPVCFMHTRGDTQTMTKLKDYENDDIVGGIQLDFNFFNFFFLSFILNSLISFFLK